MRRPHGVIRAPSRRHAACFHALRPLAPPQSLGLAHRASPSFGRVATRRVPQCIDRFGPADSHPPPPHVQGATLLTRPRGDAVGFALRVAVAFAGRGLSPPLRFSRVRVLSSSSTLLGLLRHSAISELKYGYDCPSYRKAGRYRPALHYRNESLMGRTTTRAATPPSRRRRRGRPPSP
jgi:hypothetical protein